MDGIQLTFYEFTPAPTPAPKVKIDKIPAGPVSKSKTCAITMIHELPTSEQPVSRGSTMAPAHSARWNCWRSSWAATTSRIRRPARRQRTAFRPRGTAVEQLVAVKSIGPTRAARLKATFEIGRRLQIATPEENPRSSRPPTLPTS